MMRVGIVGAVVPAETATAPSSAAASAPSAAPTAASLLPVSLVRHQAALSLWKRLRELHAAAPVSAAAPRAWEATLTALVQEGCAAHAVLHKAWVREAFDAAAAVAGVAVSARVSALEGAGIIGSGREAHIMSAIVPGLAYVLFAPRSTSAAAAPTTGVAASRDETMRGATSSSSVLTVASTLPPLLSLTPSSLTSITLLQSAMQAKGCSGRALRKLPLQAQARFFRPAITRAAGGSAGAGTTAIARTVDAATPHPCMMAFALGRTAVVEKAARASLEA